MYIISKISNPQFLSYCRQMILVKSWLKGKLDEIEVNSQDAVLKQQLLMRSRLGPEFVIFDIDFSSTARISSDRLSVSYTYVQAAGRNVIVVSLIKINSYISGQIAG